MELFIKLPEDIQRGMFRFFRHPVAAALVAGGDEWQPRIDNIRNYHITLERLENSIFPRDHAGEFGRATLLNQLWIWARENTGGWYKIWDRKWGGWGRIRHDYAIRPHTYQINLLWGVMTKEEREGFLVKN